MSFIDTPSFYLLNSSKWYRSGNGKDGSKKERVPVKPVLSALPQGLEPWTP